VRIVALCASAYAMFSVPFGALQLAECSDIAGAGGARRSVTKGLVAAN
jgi:hypothetical protein